MKRIQHALFALSLVLLAFTAGAQSDMEFGKGLKYTAKDNSFSLKFGLRIQPLLAINNRDFEVRTTPNFEDVQMTIRRGRLKFDGFAFSPKLKYKVELALGSRNLGGNVDSYNGNGARLILDAVIKYEFYKGIELWFGQTKLPGNRERVVSSQKLQFVDRNLVNGRFNIDRDMGFQLRGKHFKGMPIRWAAAVSMGEGRNVTSFNLGGIEYTGRVEFLPFGEFTKKGDYFQSDLYRESKPKLSIGVTYDQNNNAVKQRGNLGSYLFEQDTIGGELGLAHNTLKTWFVDWMFKYQGWSFTGEYALKSGEDNFKFDQSSFNKPFYVGQGISGQVGYLFKNNLEIAARYSYVMPEENVDLQFGDQTQYTLGVSKYIHGHNLKIQTDITYSQFELIPDEELQFRLQMELAL